MIDRVGHLDVESDQWSWLLEIVLEVVVKLSSQWLLLELVFEMVTGDDCQSRPLEVAVRECHGRWLQLVVGGDQILKEGWKINMERWSLSIKVQTIELFNFQLVKLVGPLANAPPS